MWDDGDLLAVRERPPSAREVHLWTIAPDAPPEVADQLATVLDAAARRRCSGLPDARRARSFVAVHGAVRVILGRYRGTAPDRLGLRAGRWGKPELVDGDGLRFSLTHSGGAVLLAVTGGGRDVGVDIEGGRPGGAAEALAARYFPPQESALVASAAPGRRRDTSLRLWTRKEACVKAAGARLALGLGLPVAGDGDVRLVDDPTGRLPAPWLVRDLDAPAGYRAAVAMAGPEPYAVRRRRLRPSDLACHLGTAPGPAGGDPGPSAGNRFVDLTEGETQP
ncbi:4'-phosphopantetheinyl transferase [Streptomyces olivaceoviridis]|uniref:4'-phosphopantetheinyl transferase family protein n=1 Tax=Streptomyces olivaceoviridis TaxID=1921 RepID=UPI001675A1D6|nr:4'-phosphopantetheinyl transferase superfamily protein [Streptomyces olivaceoviridis]GGZ09265.1 4'-phosphopantetheinyl transferase [Streptomyces olivaceoviridis]